MKFPVKYSTAQKLKALSLRTQDRSVSFSERSQAEDQYESLASSSYARGGVIKKETTMMHEKKMKTPMKMAKGGAAKTPMEKKPVLAIMIGVGKPKKDMAKGGMAKKK